MSNGDRLIWIDLEMTGLDPEQERIIEMASIITDSQLNIVAEGPVIAIHQPDSLLEQMDEWCTRTHGASGLTQRVKESTISEAEAEQLRSTRACRWAGRCAAPRPCARAVPEQARARCARAARVRVPRA